MYNKKGWISKYDEATQHIFNSPKLGRPAGAIGIDNVFDDDDFQDEPLITNTGNAGEDTPLNSPSSTSSFSLSTFIPADYQTKWRIVKRRIPYYIPVLSWLPKYKREDLFVDFIAGLTVGIMLVPQALSYAALAGVPPIFGLYTGFMPVMIYALFGNSRQLSVGPEALVSIIVGTTIGGIAETDDQLTPEDLTDLVHILSFLVGLTTLVLGLFRFGFLSEVLSRPLIRGFIIAVALTIAVEQIDVLLGLSLTSARGWHKIPAIIKHYQEIQWVAILLGISSISLLFFFKYMKKAIPPDHPKWYMRFINRFPGILIVVALGIILTYGLRLDKMGLPILGANPSGLPAPRVPKLINLYYIGELIGPAVVISIIGFVETMAVGKFFAAKHNYQLSTNREFVALGVSNIIGFVFQAWPIFGSLTRSSVSDTAGARTQMAGFITAVLIGLTLLFLMPLFYFLPRVVMASIVMVAAIGLIEIHEILFLIQVRAWKDLMLLTLTGIITFVFDAEVGLLVSVGASIFMVIKHTSVPHISILGNVPDSQKYKDVSVFKDATTQVGVLILRVEESLHFANMGQLKEMLFRLESVGSIKNHPTDPAAPPLRALIIDARAIPHVDASSLLILQELISQYKERNIRVCFVRLRDEHKTDFLNAGIIQCAGPENFFNTVHDAVMDIDRDEPSREHSTYRAEVQV